MGIQPSSTLMHSHHCLIAPKMTSSVIPSDQNIDVSTGVGASPGTRMLWIYYCMFTELIGSFTLQSHSLLFGRIKKIPTAQNRSAAISLKNGYGLLFLLCEPCPPPCMPEWRHWVLCACINTVTIPKKPSYWSQIKIWPSAHCLSSRRLSKCQRTLSW